MGVVGLVVNNLSEIIAFGVMFIGGYSIGVLKERHVPNFHLNPLRLINKFKRT